MVIRSFEEILSLLKKMETKRKIAVVCAQDEHTIEAVIQAYEDGILIPVLLGDKKEIENLLKKHNKSVGALKIVQVDSAEACVRKAAELVNAGEVHGIMKGKIETGTLMKILLDKESNLRTGRQMSLVAFMEIPTYHKIMAITDVGLNTYPNLEQKKSLIENSVQVFHALGIECPKVAIMASVEKVNEKMKETVDADTLKQWNAEGAISGCIVEGPISYDLAVSTEAAEIKGYESPVAGDADIMIVPDIVSGNLLSKALVYSGNSRTAGIIVGAKVPIIITSRSASSDDKYMSLALAALAGKNGGE